MYTAMIERSITMLNNMTIEQAIERAHAHHVANVELKSNKSLRESLAKRLETSSHVLVAFFLVIAMSLALTVLESSMTVTKDTEPVAASYSVARTVNAVLGIPTVHARAGFEGLVVSTEPAHVTVASGESAKVRVKVKNTGTEAWTQYGANYISAYTYEPKYHVSPYRGPTWLSDHQAGALVESSVAPGQIGTVEFFVYGPPGFEGELVEEFRLAAEDVSWVGNSVKVAMTVGASSSDTTVETSINRVSTPADTSSTVSASGYDGFMLIKSVKNVVARANTEVSVRAAFKNSGSKAWTSYELVPANTSLASGDSISYKHSSWVSNSVMLAVADKTVEPGALEWVDLKFTTPHLAGKYTASFQLVADGVTVENAIINLPVEVTSNAAQMLDAPSQVAPITQTVYVDGVKIEEPRVRVGIEIVEDEVVFTANKAIRVLESDLALERFIIPAGQEMRVNYNGSKYVFASGDIMHVADSYLRFQGENADTVFTVLSRPDIRSWNTSLNDNMFRDTLELRHNDKKDRTWLINELAIEYYLYGVDETSNYAPVEYHKALMTAARTYATYAWETKAKYAGEFIDMRSSTYDQVYHGYGAEIRRPTVVGAINETRGQTIQYDGDTIIAAYFSRSDGRTRSWSSVWGREVPYAVSVAVPCEVGKVKWGHGVGMSAGGAVCMADDGSTYDEILKHFYTGVDLMKRW